MCASFLITNLDSKSEKLAEEHSSMKKRSHEKLEDAKKKTCILNKKIMRSQNRNTVNPQINLCIKSNKKFLQKDSCISTIPKFIISCRYCKRNFETVEQCQNHVCTITKSQTILNELVKYSCHLCLKIFKKKNTLDKHLKDHNRNSCNHCNVQFTMRKELCKHLKNDHIVIGPDKFYICAMCKKSFCKKDSLNLHMISHGRGKTTCNQSDLLCEDEIAYEEHMKVHLKNLKHKCQVCNKMFIDSQRYNQHMMTHKKHVCELCNITYTTNKLLIKHQHDLHGAKVAKKHTCEICDKRFNRPLHLTIHKRVHTGEKPLKCLDCNKNYYSNKTFAKHLKTIRHLKKVSLDKEVILEKKYACEQCEARFFNLQDLQRHVQILHSTGEPLKCDYCTYSTKCKANLKRHSEVHSQAKRFACELCGQTFRSFGSLKDHHAFIHSDKREFFCNICNKSFKVNRDLQRHKKIHNDDKPYKCSCTRSFKRLSHLKRHFLSCKHIDLLDENAQADKLDKNMLDDALESCDDPNPQFSNKNHNISNNLFLEPEVISSSNVPISNGESILTSTDFNLHYNDKSSDASVLYPLGKTIEHSVVTLTDTISTKNISSQLPEVFENTLITITDQISTRNIGLPFAAVNRTGGIPSQTTTIPLTTAIVKPPVMALTTSKPSGSISPTILTKGVKQPLINFSENNISLLTVPSVVEQPVINFIDSNIPSNSNKSMIEIATSIDQSALNVVINKDLSVEKVKTKVVHKEPFVSNEETHQCESQTLPHNSFESISTNIDNNSLNNFTKSNVLNTTNYIQTPILQLQNIPTVVVPKSTVKEYHNPLPTYSIITQNLGDQLLVKNKDVLCSIPKSKNFVSTELSNIEHKGYSGELLEQTNVLFSLSTTIPNAFCIPDASSQPVNLPLNTDPIDENFNQLLSLFNLDNVMGSFHNSVESSLPNYPVTVNNLIFSNETLLNSLLNNTGFEYPS